MSELVLVANAGDGTISTLRLDGATLSPLATSPVGKGVGTFAVDAARDLVIAGIKADGDEPAAVVTLHLDRTSGRLTERSRRAVDDSQTYLSLTDDGRHLLGASYGGGFGSVWPVASDGSVGEPTARIEYPNLHCVVTEGSHAYFVSLGADLVAQYALADGALEELGEVPFPAGCGPRHLLLDGPNAYLITEYTAEVFHLTRAEDGTLTRGNAVVVVDPSAHLEPSRMGADPKAEGLIWGADLHRAGRFLVCSERNASTLASVVVADDGALGIVAALARTVEQPRGFGVSGDGRHVIAVGEKATDAELLRVEDDGTLTSLGRTPIGHGANWVRVIAQ